MPFVKEYLDSGPVVANGDAGKNLSSKYPVTGSRSEVFRIPDPAVKIQQARSQAKANFSWRSHRSSILQES
jgi:hypothetical protein